MRDKLKSKSARAGADQRDGRNGKFLNPAFIVPKVPEKSIMGKDRINWLQRQMEADQRRELFHNAGDPEAEMIANTERDFCANRHAGTAIYGENYFDQGDE